MTIYKILHLPTGTYLMWRKSAKMSLYLEGELSSDFDLEESKFKTRRQVEIKMDILAANLTKSSDYFGRGTVSVIEHFQVVEIPNDKM